MATQTAMSDTDYVNRYKDALSGTTRRAKWIASPGEPADRDGQTLATRDHDVIRRWAEARGAVPVTVGGTGEHARPRTLRLDFPSGDERGGRNRPQEVDWDSWFRAFDARELVFLFQENLSSGAQSSFFLFDSPHRDED